MFAERNQMPLQIVLRFYSLFTVSKYGDRGRSTVIGSLQKAKILHYIQIVFLTLNNFEFSIDELAKDLKMTQKEFAISSLLDLHLLDLFLTTKLPPKGSLPV